MMIEHLAKMELHGDNSPESVLVMVSIVIALSLFTR